MAAINEALKSIKDNEPQIVLLPDANYVAAVVALRNYTDRYLYVARLLDLRVQRDLLLAAENDTPFIPRGDDLVAKCTQVSENVPSLKRTDADDVGRLVLL